LTAVQPGRGGFGADAAALGSENASTIAAATPKDTIFFISLLHGCSAI
jgi:hypothetical protein